MTKKRKSGGELKTVARAVAHAVAMSAALGLAACASDDAAPAETADAGAPPAQETAPAPAPAPSLFGAPSPRFFVPSTASQSPPSVNTVPTDAPTPSSTEEEREQARRGLIADLANARHSEQGGRTSPVVVRPYVETAASRAPAPAAADAAPDEAITNRLDAPPPARPTDADGNPAPAVGPAMPGAIPTGS